MLIYQDFGKEVSIDVGNSQTKPVAIGTTVATVYVKRTLNTVVPTPFRFVFRNVTKAVVRTRVYPLRSVSVPVVTTGDNYPIKKLTNYLKLAGPVVSRLVVTDDTSINKEYIPNTEQNYINDLTSNVFVTPSNTDVPVSYYNATGTFWSTG
jgi:hypothetical protein